MNSTKLKHSYSRFPKSSLWFNIHIEWHFQRHAAAEYFGGFKNHSTHFTLLGIWRWSLRMSYQEMEPMCLCPSKLSHGRIIDSFRDSNEFSLQSEVSIPSCCNVLISYSKMKITNSLTSLRGPVNQNLTCYFLNKPQMRTRTKRNCENWMCALPLVKMSLPPGGYQFL